MQSEPRGAECTGKGKSEPPGWISICRTLDCLSCSPAHPGLLAQPAAPMGAHTQDTRRPGEPQSPSQAEHFCLWPKLICTWPRTSQMGCYAFLQVSSSQFTGSSASDSKGSLYLGSPASPFLQYLGPPEWPDIPHSGSVHLRSGGGGYNGIGDSPFIII